LPSLSPPLKKPSRGFAGFVRPRRVVRFFLSILSLTCLFYAVTWIIENVSIFSLPLSNSQHNALTQDDIPAFPAAVVVTDKRGRASWTVSIPPTSDFPLTIDQTTALCATCREVSEKVQVSRSGGHGIQQTYLGLRSSTSDPYYVDVQEAQEAGYLSGGGSSSLNPAEQEHKGEIVGENIREKISKPQCERSLTFVLESADAGLGQVLIMLWTAYGLAQQEGRAFFIDDTRWAYGKYTDIFQSPPRQDCGPPPRHEMLPCPRQARHLMASTATASELFGSLIRRSDPGEPLDSHSQKAMFALARQGHDALFKLNKEDAEYVDSRTRDLMAKRIVPKTKGQQNGLAIGVHIRRGDCHPFEYQYRDSYVPLNVYAQAARELVEDRFNHTGPLGGEDRAAKEHSYVVLASDDPMMHESGEFTAAAMPNTTPAQERIRLASKQAIQNAAPPDRHVMHKFVDDTFGWEGGFFAAMFWNLGKSSHSASAAESASPSPESVRLRSLVGRAYMMDLAVLADASDVVVCTVSATGCRLLAVMMGWDSALEEGNWVNVDGSYGWIGVS